MSTVTLNTESFVKVLNGHLEAASYIEGFTPSQLDSELFAVLTEAPNAQAYPHAARWYKHIASHGDAAKSFAAPAAAAAEAEEDDDIDLFGSDDEVDEEAERLKEQRLAEYRAKKATKPTVIAKSMVLFDVKPWDDETNMAELEAHVRSIEMPGLTWGKSQLLPVGFGIKKLQIGAVIEDDKVSTADLEDKIVEFEDHVQSVDIQAFNKL
ncbi:Translation elongation factor 1 beta [Dimargaris cristalligena]|uniref:Elongation factor 1-beta-like protein n=1 Tax=Dimargaris cristalligena TaxID=215637 RepID=A0A4P9ZTE6_9FUNG|nr:Translation elongation factor 1 beta [Dimargaris cristalligena]RKP35800.1 elongation factor 1-beta-like protein [Dimargaris cristalligena]|eukprot:RKP35800.1 elongation factor 1-beta-like protein [Dimargaris cristalligena]